MSTNVVLVVVLGVVVIRFQTTKTFSFFSQPIVIKLCILIDDNIFRNCTDAPLCTVHRA